MVKVYDMVTYGICDRDREAPPAQNPPARSTDLHPEIGLQPLEHAAPERKDLLPPSMRGVDIAAFLTNADAD